MTKIEALKELFKINLEKLKRYTHIKELSIAFDEDGFVVINNNNEIVLKNNFSNYDLSHNGQIKFVLDIVGSVASLPIIEEEPLSEEDYYIDDEELYTNNIIKIEGSGYLFDPSYGIDIDLKPFLSLNGDKKICEIYEKYKKELIFKKNILKKDLEFGKFLMYLVTNNKQHNFTVCIGKNMYNRPMCLGFVKELKKIEDPNNPENLIIDNVRCVLDYEILYLYYSLTTDEELKEAVETVKKNLGEFSKEFAEKLKRNEI